MNSTFRAALWMSGSITSFSAMAVAGRELTAHFDTFEIMLYRSAIGAIVMLAIAIASGKLHQITTKNLRLQVFRNLAHFTGQNLWFYAVSVISLAEVFALEFTSPLWVILLSYLILGEKLTMTRTVAGLMGFIGILIVARPTVDGLNAGILAAAACAIFFALTNVCTKRLTRTQSVLAIMVYLTTLQLLFGLITAGYDGDIAVPHTSDLPWLLVVGAAGLLAHFCLTNALAIAPATVVIPIDFIRLPVIAIVGMLAYNEGLDLWVFVGAAVIFAGNYLNIWSETRRRPIG